jgi:phosphatidate phosphatase APP1
MKKNKYMIQVYISFVTASHLYIKGRVLKDRSPVSFVDQGPVSSMFNTILRVRSKELPNTAVSCVFGGHIFEEVTDSEGYFEIFHNITNFESIPKKVTIRSEMKGGRIEFDRILRTYQYDVAHGIISDIDDTILVTKVRSLFRLKLLFNLIFINPFRRKPIENASEALHSMLAKTEGLTPMIYLSNSPWNIYDYLQAFLLHNTFPVGEVILRDIGFQLLRSRDIKEYNKYIEIEKLLVAFGDTNFTLIGDTGELDFDIYKAILEKYPHRIEQIILNNAGNEKKIAEVEEYVKKEEIDKIKITNEFENLH